MRGIEVVGPMRGGGLAASVAMGLAVLSLTAGLSLASPASVPAAAVRPATVTIPDNGTLHGYNSSVDGFALSFEEWLPSGYVSARSYPLFLYLHGLEAQLLPNPGGWTNEIVGFLTARGPVGNTARGLVANASTYGVILIAPNTRTGNGYFVNSKCTGPQEQDILDAVTAEKALRHVSSVYLIGFSAGTLGAFSIAAHHPGVFKGIGVSAPGTDIYESNAYAGYEAVAKNSTFMAMVHNASAPMMCGGNPTNSTYANSIAYYLSAARFYPTNLSAVRMYIAAGGNDNLYPNNGSTWPFLEINNTFVNSTCNVAPSEPKNCTTTFRSLHLANPKLYLFRYVYEPNGPHILALLDPQDMFLFLLGREFPGFYHATYPPKTILPGG